MKQNSTWASFAASSVMVWVMGASVCLAAPTPEQVEFFESRIRPILAQECYECHSEATKAKGGLLLDTRDGWQKGGDSGSGVIVPGKPDDSLLLQSIAHLVEDLEMPKAGAKLEQTVLADFRKWIAMGAPDPRDEPPSKQQLAEDTNWEAVRERRKGWWSFQPIVRPEIPAGEEAGHRVALHPVGRHPVDHFVQTRLQKEGLSVSPQADPRTLHRRISFSLIGLPPTAEQSAKFLAAWEKDSDKAITNLVDGLLNDSKFGEKWARHWMDWLRYADSHGSEGDPTIPHSWQYRDYLIRALNADVSYDQLVLEHLAGDLLEKPRINEELQINESAIGPAHLRMVFHGFAPTDALDERVRFTDDKINTVTKAFQALTVSCARCHDHKFDAISQADYYALFGIFTSALPATIAIDTPGLLEKNRDVLAETKAKIQQGMTDHWLDTLSSDPEVWMQHLEKEDVKGDALRLLRSFSDAKNVTEAWEAAREQFEKSRADIAKVRTGEDVRHRWDLSDPKEVASWTNEGEGLLDGEPSPAGFFEVGVSGKVVERIFPSGVYSHALSTKHRGLLASPPFLLDGEYDLYLNVVGDGASARYAVQHYPRSGTVYPVTKLEKGEWKWQKYGRIDYWNGDHIHLELNTAGEAPILVSGKERSWFGIREAILVKKGSPSPFIAKGESLAAVFSEEAKAPQTFEEAVLHYEGVIRSLLESWKTNEAALDDASALFLDEMLQAGLLANKAEQVPGPLRELVANYRKWESEIPRPTYAPGLVERPGRDQPLYVRGNHKEPGDPVPRRFLESIDESPYETEGSGRLEFAQDLLRQDNPFTARVIVNRLWHHLFGSGLVSTADNFGRLGEEPSHPELLDFLAARFREEQDWSIKSLVRDLVLTDTWQQSSLASPGALEKDPDNRLLSHFSIRRLEAEAIRDSLLAVSGQLQEKAFGAPVSGATPRRSLYLQVKRNSLDPLLTTFDFPVPASTVGRRDSTNVPGQSLTLLNDRFIIEQARHWAKAMRESLPDETQEEARIRHLFSAALNRDPDENELTGARNFLYAIDRENEGSAEQFTKVEKELKEAQSELQAILNPVRERLLANRRKQLENSGGSPAPVLDFQPIARWDFDGDLSDSIGNLSASLVGTARLEGGALVVDGNGFAATPPLQRELGEKTLEALVQLDTFDQPGAGILTVQDLRGQDFDSIVFAERKPQEWLVGSNNHKRTLEFEAGKETEAIARPVHVVITFEKDGTIRGYRDGQPWGKAVRKAPLHVFKSGDTQVVFGLRHGTSPSGNRPMKGRILEARLYDRALEPGEVQSVASGDPLFVSHQDVLESLTDAQLEQKKLLEEEIESLSASLKSLRALGSDVPLEERRWQDLAHAIFNLKEFIYLR